MLSTVKSVLWRSLPTPIFRLYKQQKERLTRRKTPRIKLFDEHTDAVLKCCIGYNRYGAYCVPLSSMQRPAVQAILAGTVWEPDTIKLITATCGTGDIIHAGTFFGDFLPALGHAAQKVWAFEPNPESFRCAEITKRINALGNVELVNSGLGERSEQLQMAILDASGRALGGWSHIATETSRPTIPVRIASIDDVISPDRNVSIIQLDIEGFELKALKGAIATIRRCKPLLVLETLPNDQWIKENILQMGYFQSGKVHDNFVLSPS